MKALLVGVVVGLLVGATGAPAEDVAKRIFWERAQLERSHQYTPRQAARALVADFLAPIVRPDTQPVRPRLRPCRRLGRWYACRAVVEGKTTCRAVVHVLDPAGDRYAGWVPRLRCR